MGTTKKEFSEHDFFLFLYILLFFFFLVYDVLILSRGCTPFCWSLMGTPALPAPAEISLNSVGLRGQGLCNMFTRCVAISNILLLLLINGEERLMKPGSKEGQIASVFGF